ncbi:unnamed protein product [Ciceribacter sp. T2.26MG-112.2]|nr:unnamed protein product [Ciceribacter naphthalenivorans]
MHLGIQFPHARPKIRKRASMRMADSVKLQRSIEGCRKWP